MNAWTVVSLAAGFGFVVTVLALLGGGRATRRGAPQPAWLVPTPIDARRTRFPLAFQGYDPEHVDVHLDALAAAYEELYAAAGPEVVARAEERLALRLHRGDDPVQPDRSDAR